MSDLDALMADANDAVVAAVDMIGRTGATNVEVGFDEDRDPVEWWARAQYRGAAVFVEHLPTPGHALDALLVRLLDGAHCAHCNRDITNDPKKSTSTRYCFWWRAGDHYESRCARRPGRARR